MVIIVAAGQEYLFLFPQQHKIGECMATAYSAEVESILTKATATVDELAVLLGIGRRQAYEAVQRGDIPSIRLGHRILISTRVINQILDVGTVESGAA